MFVSGVQYSDPALLSLSAHQDKLCLLRRLHPRLPAGHHRFVLCVRLSSVACLFLPTLFGFVSSTLSVILWYLSCSDLFHLVSYPSFSSTLLPMAGFPVSLTAASRSVVCMCTCVRRSVYTRAHVHTPHLLYRFLSW